MLNFSCYNPTRIVFGQETIPQLAQLCPADAVILLLYGGGSIKQNGVYEQTLAALCKHTVVEYAGIEANPQFDTCIQARDLARAENVSFILAVGGGSVIDAAKFISLAIQYDGDAWDIPTNAARPTEAIPLGTVLTLPATGSEMNANSVISRSSLQAKEAFSNEAVFPVFSILDPSVTTSLPLRQTLNGIVDAFMHICEQYATRDCGARLQERQAEAILSSLIEVAPLLLADPDNYQHRATLMWCATQALNTTLGSGVVHDWATHMISHYLTAHHGLDHGQALAVTLTHLWRHKIEAKRERLQQYGQRVLGLSETSSAEDAICATEEFFHSLGVPTSVTDYGLSEADCLVLADAATADHLMVGEDRDIDGTAMKEILLASLNK